jgi:hypothetical protein
MQNARASTRTPQTINTPKYTTNPNARKQNANSNKLFNVLYNREGPEMDIVNLRKSTKRAVNGVRKMAN